MADTSVPAIVPTVVDEPLDFTVIATSPGDMQRAQRSLILWAARKIQMVKNELEAAREQLRLHQEHKWSTAGWRSEILRKERRADFYRKIKMALEAGYYIVPPFPLEIFAIRTKREAPRPNNSTNPRSLVQSADVLPAGEGRYVDVTPYRSDYVENEKRGDKTVPVRYYYATEYQDVDFPFKLARAEIRSATDKAMSLGIFDQLGVLPQRRAPDPIVCGQILVPNKPYYRFATREAITFFVAWWLDTKTM